MKRSAVLWKHRLPLQVVNWKEWMIKKTEQWGNRIVTGDLGLSSGATSSTAGWAQLICLSLLGHWYDSDYWPIECNSGIHQYKMIMDYLNVSIFVTMIDLQLFVWLQAEHPEIYKLVLHDPCLRSFGNHYKGLPWFSSSCDALVLARLCHTCSRSYHLSL